MIIKGNNKQRGILGFVRIDACVSDVVNIVLYCNI